MGKVRVLKGLIVVVIFGIGFSNMVRAGDVTARNESETTNAYHKDDPSKDILYYPRLEKEDISKPNVKFYSNKEFNGNPTAIVNDDGFFVHNKKICQWHKDFKKAPEYKFMYPVGKPEEQCLGFGLVNSWVGGIGGGGIFDIEVDTNTSKYYEIIFNNEKFYINPEELKGFKFIESVKKKEAKKIADFQKLLKDNPSLEKFIKAKRECIAKKDMKCLLPDDNKQDQVIRGWLEDVCGVEPANTSDTCSKLRVSDQNPTFEGEIENAFWKGAATCFPNDLTKVKSELVGVSSDIYAIVNMDKIYMGECRIKKNEKKMWEMTVEISTSE